MTRDGESRRVEIMPRLQDPKKCIRKRRFRTLPGRSRRGISQRTCSLPIVIAEAKSTHEGCRNSPHFGRRCMERIAPLCHRCRNTVMFFAQSTGSSTVFGFAGRDGEHEPFDGQQGDHVRQAVRSRRRGITLADWQPPMRGVHSRDPCRILACPPSSRTTRRRNVGSGQRRRLLLGAAARGSRSFSTILLPICWGFTGSTRPR